MKHERRVVGHVSGWKEQMNTCVCGKPWPCQELEQRSSNERFLRDALETIKKGPPATMGNDEVAAWATWIAATALSQGSDHRCGVRGFDPMKDRCPACSPDEPPARHPMLEVLEVCDAYESGIGQGLKNKPMGEYKNPYDPVHSPHAHRAYGIGYDEGAKRAAVPPSACPECAHREAYYAQFDLVPKGSAETKSDPHAKYVCVNPEFEVKIADETTAAPATCCDGEQKLGPGWHAPDCVHSALNR